MWWKTDIILISECNCYPSGTLDDTICEKENGNCHCKDGYIGKDCDTCDEGYYMTEDDVCHGDIRNHF